MTLLKTTAEQRAAHRFQAKYAGNPLEDEDVEALLDDIDTLLGVLGWAVQTRPCFNCGDGGDPSEAEDLKHWCGECENKRTEYPSAKECRDRIQALLPTPPGSE